MTQEGPPVRKNSRLDGLTKRQMQFLAVRPKFHTDKEAAESGGFSTASVTFWKREPAFLAAYDRIWASARQAISDYNTDRAKAELVPPAFARMSEIVNMKLDGDTPAPMVNQVRQAATTVLAGVGILKPEDSNEFLQTLGKFITEGRKYRPRWRVEPASLPESVEGETRPV